MSSPDLDALIAQATGRGNPLNCWASKLEGTAADLIARYTVIEQAAPRSVTRAVVSRQLAQFGVKASPEVIGRHFRGDCACV